MYVILIDENWCSNQFYISFCISVLLMKYYTLPHKRFMARVQLNSLEAINNVEQLVNLGNQNVPIHTELLTSIVLNNLNKLLQLTSSRLGNILSIYYLSESSVNAKVNIVCL